MQGGTEEPYEDDKSSTVIERCAAAVAETGRSLLSLPAGAVAEARAVQPCRVKYSCAPNCASAPRKCAKLDLCT